MASSCKAKPKPAEPPVKETYSDGSWTLEYRTKNRKNDPETHKTVEEGITRLVKMSRSNGNIWGWGIVTEGKAGIQSWGRFKGQPCYGNMRPYRETKETEREHWPNDLFDPFPEDPPVAFVGVSPAAKSMNKWLLSSPLSPYRGLGQSAEWATPKVFIVRDCGVDANLFGGFFINCRGVSDTYVDPIIKEMGAESDIELAAVYYTVMGTQQVYDYNVGSSSLQRGPISHGWNLDVHRSLSGIPATTAGLFSKRGAYQRPVIENIFRSSGAENGVWKFAGLPDPEKNKGLPVADVYKAVLAALIEHTKKEGK